MGGARPGCAGRSQVRTWAAILVETMLPLPAGEAPELPPHRVLFFPYTVSLPEFGSPVLSWTLPQSACRF